MCSRPPRSPTIVGSAVDTIVWSSDASSITSISALMTSPIPPFESLRPTVTSVGPRGYDGTVGIRADRDLERELGQAARPAAAAVAGPAAAGRGLPAGDQARGRAVP